MTAACPFCVGEEVVSLFEAWTDHRFLLEACCEGLHDEVCTGLAEDPGWARELLASLGAEALPGRGRLRRVSGDGGAGLLLDWRLAVRPVPFARARLFVERHHRHCGPPPGWKFGAGCWNGPTLVGVAMAGNPVARALRGGGRTVEVNRLCVRRDVPAALRRNAASKLYGWAAAEARRRGFAKVVTYTRADEPGTSLVAAGWAREAAVRGRGWHRAGAGGSGRARSDRNAWIDKVRWGRALAPAADRPADGRTPARDAGDRWPHSQPTS